VDGLRVAFRQLAPHEAANIYIAQLKSVQPYQPKYSYSVQATTYTYGNTTHTQGTVNREEDPYHKIGYALGSMIVGSKNKKLLNLAGNIYVTGFTNGSKIPSQTAAIGGIYWLKRRSYTEPLTIRFVDTNYEISFKKVR
jgi:hypothetical protein